MIPVGGNLFIEKIESFSDIVDPKGSIVNSPRWSRGNIMGPNRWAPKGVNHSMLFAPFGDVPSGRYWIPRLHRGLFTVSPFRTNSDTKTFKPDNIRAISQASCPDKWAGMAFCGGYGACIQVVASCRICPAPFLFFCWLILYFCRSKQ